MNVFIKLSELKESNSKASPAMCKKPTEGISRNSIESEMKNAFTGSALSISDLICECLVFLSWLANILFGLKLPLYAVQAWPSTGVGLKCNESNVGIDGMFALIWIEQNAL